MIGSTANIIAMGIFEKRFNHRISFLYWLKSGLVVGMLTMLISFLIIIAVPWYTVR